MDWLFLLTNALRAAALVGADYHYRDCVIAYYQYIGMNYFGAVVLADLMYN